MIGPIVILVLFLLIAPTTREGILLWLGKAGDFISAWAPASYIVILLLLAAPFVSAALMMTWPKTPEPENPLKRYSDTDDVVPD
jgi:hypothetical protein